MNVFTIVPCVIVYCALFIELLKYAKNTTHLKRYYGGIYGAIICSNKQATSSFEFSFTSSQLVFPPDEIVVNVSQSIIKTCSDGNTKLIVPFLYTSDPLPYDPFAHVDVYGGKEYVYTVLYSILYENRARIIQVSNQNPNWPANPKEFTKAIQRSAGVIDGQLMFITNIHRSD